MNDFIQPQDRLDPSCGGRTAVNPPLSNYWAALWPLVATVLFLIAFMATGYGLLILGSLICAFAAAIESDSRALSKKILGNKDLPTPYNGVGSGSNE